MSTATPSGTAPPGCRVMLLEQLLRIRRDMEAGRLEMHLGETNIHRLVG